MTAAAFGMSVDKFIAVGFAGVGAEAYPKVLKTSRRDRMSSRDGGWQISMMTLNPKPPKP